jgi:mono/diheme cytochrome c family protein
MIIKTIVFSLSIITLSIATLSACNTEEKPTMNGDNGRWYSKIQVTQGATVFKANCAVCHGDQAQGLVADWKQALPNGQYPAPPLNSTAHAWHHDKAQLLRSINNGGVPLGGTMPAFADKLTDEEKLASIAYFQSFWPDKTYQIWGEK